MTKSPIQHPKSCSKGGPRDSEKFRNLIVIYKAVCIVDEQKGSNQGPVKGPDGIPGAEGPLLELETCNIETS